MLTRALSLCRAGGKARTLLGKPLGSVTHRHESPQGLKAQNCVVSF